MFVRNNPDDVFIPDADDADNWLVLPLLVIGCTGNLDLSPKQ